MQAKVCGITCSQITSMPFFQWCWLSSQAWVSWMAWRVSSGWQNPLHGSRSAPTCPCLCRESLLAQVYAVLFCIKCLLHKPVLGSKAQFTPWSIRIQASLSGIGHMFGWKSLNWQVGLCLSTFCTDASCNLPVSWSLQLQNCDQFMKALPETRAGNMKHTEAML